MELYSMVQFLKGGYRVATFVLSLRQHLGNAVTPSCILSVTSRPRNLRFYCNLSFYLLILNN